MKAAKTSAAAAPGVKQRAWHTESLRNNGISAASPIVAYIGKAGWLRQSRKLSAGIAAWRRRLLAGEKSVSGQCGLNGWRRLQPSRGGYERLSGWLAVAVGFEDLILQRVKRPHGEIEGCFSGLLKSATAEAV